MTDAATNGTPELSLVMPCYNEEGSVVSTVPRLMDAFHAAGHRVELVAVDNGSEDRTRETLRALTGRYPQVRVAGVELNQGYGWGILSGIPLCTADWVGFIPADGQVDAEDVVRLWEAAKASDGRVVAKVRRRFRMDGPVRKLVSIAYNLLVRLMWPTLATLDVNGVPKILPRRALMAMQLESRGWFLDPELMVKAHYMGLRILEFNVFARMRGRGESHVKAETCWEFLRNLLRYRFSRDIGKWRAEVRRTRITVREGIG
ncbi:MAG: glycosyltransferase family 2 protein [Longimicrobiales bacterium]